MQKNDIYEVDIIDSGMEGEGVARLDGKIVFIPYTLKNEKVRIRIIDIRKDYLRGQCIKVIEPSPDRIAPECPYYFKCGGCNTMHIKKSCEKQMKINEFKKNMSKIAGIRLDNVEFIASDINLGYRNKVQFPFGFKNGQIVVGYYANNTHNVIPIDKCLLNGAWASEIVQDFLAFANAEHLTVYDERSGKGLLRHLILRNINGKISIVIVINGVNIPNIEHYHTAPHISLFYSVNTKRTNVILGEKLIHIRGNKTINTVISDIAVELSPDAFMQVNDNVREKLYNAALEKFDSDTVCIDLYSGIGITTNLLAKKCNKVYSIEIIPNAVNNARNMAKINGNEDKIIAICGDASAHLPQIIDEINMDTSLIKSNKKSVSVLIDPPRKGCDLKVIKAIAKTLPDKIVYISCNHATLARDLKLLQSLSENAYILDTPILFDMFPNTHHVEALFCLNRKGVQ